MKARRCIIYVFFVLLLIFFSLLLYRTGSMWALAGVCVCAAALWLPILRLIYRAYFS